MATVADLRIGLETACDFPDCSLFGYPLFSQLRGGDYDVMAAMRIPGDVTEWRADHRTARKRADRCGRRGYAFTLVRPEERTGEIHAVNTSAAHRQGRPMSSGYQTKPVAKPDPVYPCLRHSVRRYGVETAAGELVAYLWLYRAGELALVSQILGHQQHLENEVMYLLWQGMVEHESAEPDGFIVYNRWDSGQDGLRFFKERVGLAETRVRWAA